MARGIDPSVTALMEDEMDGTHFDGIARALARGMNRRAAARGVAAAVGLGVVALGRGRAAAQDPRSRCKEYCRAQGLEGRDFGQCVSACARAGGPPPVETCVELGEVCTPPLDENDLGPCCFPEGNVCYPVDLDDPNNPYRCIPRL
jgi:hypothetical protein